MSKTSLRTYQLSNDDGTPFALLVPGHLTEAEAKAVVDEENLLWCEEVFSLERMRLEHAQPATSQTAPWLLQRLSGWGAIAVTLFYFDGVEIPGILDGEDLKGEKVFRRVETNTGTVEI